MIGLWGTRRLNDAWKPKKYTVQISFSEGEFIEGSMSLVPLDKHCS